MTIEQPPYQFSSQVKTGTRGETFLDDFFSRWFQIAEAGTDDQRRGIDRYFTTRNHKRRFSVEYKTDERAARTGNAFIETISVDSSGKAGWAYTSQADYLLYYVPETGLIYMMKMGLIREHLSSWKEEYPLRQIPNQGYHTHGLLVPLIDLEHYAEAVFNANGRHAG